MNKNIKTTDWLIHGMSSADINTGKTLALLSAFIELEQTMREMSNKEFAKVLGVSQRKLSKWKSGIHDFSISELVYIFDILNITMKQVFAEIYHIEGCDKNDKSTD